MPQKHKHFYLFLLILVVITLFGRAESTDDFLKIALARNEILLKNPPLINVSRLINAQPYRTSRVDAVIELQRTMLATLGNDIGFRLSGSYLHNTSLGMVNADEPPYLWRVYAGIEWNMLNNGLLKRKRERDLLRCEINIGERDRAAEINNEKYRYVYDWIIYLFNVPKSENLEERCRLIEELLTAKRMQALQQPALAADCFALQRDLERAHNLLDNSRQFATAFRGHGVCPDPELTWADLPIVDIDLQAFLARESRLASVAEKRKFNRFAAEYRHQYLLDAQLQMLLRYNHYDTPDRDFFSIGLNLNLPFPFQLRQRSSNIELDERQRNLQHEMQEEDDSLEALNYYYENKYKLDDLIQYNFKLAGLLDELDEIDLRHRLQPVAVAPGSHAACMKRILETQYEIIDIRQQLYLRLLGMLRHSDSSDLTAFLRPVNFTPIRDLAAAVYPGERSMYIWSAAFNNLDNDLLVPILRRRAIRHVLVSFGRQTDRAKLREFIKLASTRGIDTYAMFSVNEWLFTEKQTGMEDAIRQLNGYGVAGVHFDVEPQSLPEWKGNRDEYRILYRRMLKKIRDLTKQSGYRLDVSLSPSVPENDLREIFAMCDKVYVMAYELPELESLSKRLRGVWTEKAGQVVVALRNIDFSGENDLEQLISGLLRETPFRAVALYDLQAILDLGAYHEAKK